MDCTQQEQVVSVIGIELIRLFTAMESIFIGTIVVILVRRLKIFVNLILTRFGIS